MSEPIPKPTPQEHALLEVAIGYLNFSSGASDPKFLRTFDTLFEAVEGRCEPAELPLNVLCDWLDARMTELSAACPTYRDIGQARAVLTILREHLLPAYRAFHRDLLWHQSDRELWRPLFIGRALEVILSQGPPWNETKRIVERLLETLNDYLGYRPVAVLESERPLEPYAHERVRPIPLYIKDVGVAQGIYRELLERSLNILNEIDPEIRQQAWFDPQLVEELSLDPRAYDFDHPASKRPNHHFGQWDLNHVDNRGYYRRFVLQQMTLDALLSRLDAPTNGKNGNDKSTATNREELIFEAAAVLAGTILMASGTTGNGPGCHNSDVTLSTLLPHIAAYRDQFYEDLLKRTSGTHGERLRAESQRTRQPFGGARQHLNQELARRRQFKCSTCISHSSMLAWAIQKLPSPKPMACASHLPACSARFTACSRPGINRSTLTSWIRSPERCPRLSNFCSAASNAVPWSIRGISSGSAATSACSRRWKTRSTIFAWMTWSISWNKSLISPLAHGPKPQRSMTPSVNPNSARP